MNAELPDSLNHRLMGWFAVALSKELKRNQVMHGVLADTPYCLSRSEVGMVQFNNKTDTIVERNGIIYAWHHPQGIPPSWQVPILDETNWSAFRYYQLTARTHPQEVYENSIDLSHFPIVHGFKQITLEQSPVFDKHCMTVRHRIRRKNPFIPRGKALSAEFEVRLHGLGCAHTHINVSVLKMQVRMVVVTTPIHTGHVKIRLGVAISNHLKLPLKFLFLPILHWAIHKNIVRDFCQDIPIWENKCFHFTPLLVKGDGPIMKFRHWCQQFKY
ncbi:MAG: hypothetical protein H0W64_04985 [Gammaproteobacteria bacterium]|nr:hypothetical protein [Gammaproteobacteria bacterium]